VNLAAQEEKGQRSRLSGAARSKMRILCNIVLALLSWSAFAQAPTATLSGKVTDQTGAVIPQATVTLSTASGTRATATTDQLGGYQIQSLPAGSYNVSATAKGFANFSRSNVALGPGQSQTLDVTLQVKAQEEKVNVNGEEGQPQLDVSSDSNAGALIITLAVLALSIVARTLAAVRKSV